MAYTLTYTLNSDGNSYTLSGYDYSVGQPTGPLVIPDTYNSKPVTIIGNSAFSLCTEIATVTIGSNITSIGKDAFWGCSSLTSVTFGESSQLTSIGESAFYNCSSLTTITIPDSVTAIDYGAFDGCSSLVTITIPNNVISIGEWVFSGCTGLASVTIGNGLTSIGKNAFYNCSGLASINVAPDNTKYHSSGNCIIETATNTLVVGCKTSIIPTDGSVTSIGDYAFSHYDGLTSIDIPDSITTLGEGAFYFCTGLTNITIPEKVTSIGNSAFHGCSGLTSITIPDSVTSIGDYALAYCTSLTKINMLPTTPPTIQSNTFTSTTLQSIYVPAKCREDYITATNWNANVDKITEFPILDLGSLLMYNNKVKEKIEKKLDKTNPNLIVNSNFSINQKGQPSYSGYTNNSISTVDRWDIYNNMTFDVATKTLTNNVNTLPAFFIQNNKHFNTLYGKTVTLSCLINNVRYSTSTTVASSYSSNQVITDIGTPTVKFELAYNSTRGIFVQFRLNAKESAVIDECKLELGSVATAYITPIYEEEIWKCNAVYGEPAPLSNPNLLLNPNFAINQRGQKDYTGNGYTVDAWRGGQAQAKVSVRDNGITLSFSEAISGAGIAVQQKIDIDPLKLIGKTISISAKISSVISKYWYCRIRYANSSGVYNGELSADITESGVVSASGVVPENTASMMFQFLTRTGVSIRDSLTVEWAKVELGAVATEFIPPLVSEELVKCKASERLDGVISAGKLTDPFIIGSDAKEPQTWVTKFATMTLKAAWVSSSARFDIVDNNYANISTQPVGVEISASPTATDLTLRAYVLYGNPEILKRMHLSYSAVGTFPMTVDLYYVSGNSGYSSIGIKPLWQSHRNTASSLEFITTNTNVSKLPTDRTNICVTDLTNYGPITRAYSATTLNSFVVKGRQAENVGWHKAMEIKAVNIGNVGQAGYSALILVNGVRGSTGESVTPAGSSIIEIDCRADNATNGAFLTGFLRVNILNGWLNKDNICAVLSEGNKTISVYINIEQQFMQYNLTKLSEGAEGVENVNALTFVDEYYGSSAPTGAIYAQILNNASTTYATKADELSYFSVGTTATSNNNWYEIATVPLNVGNFDAFSIVLLLNGRKIGAQMSGIVELEGRSDAENGWTYKNFKVLCGNLASTHIAYWEDPSDKTIHFYLWAPSTTYAISTISAQRGNGLNITNPLTELQPSELPSGLIYGANFNHAAYDSHSNYIPDTYATKANLLINPDFSINQRGQGTYEPTTADMYGVDRWLISKGTKAEINKDTGALKLIRTASGNCCLQRIEDWKKLVGKTVTLSVKFSQITAGSVKCNIYTGTTFTGTTVSTSGSVSTVTTTIPTNATKLECFIYANSACEVVPEYAKLEIGSTATAFVPPLKNEELPKCQRYYQKFTTNSDYREYAIGFITLSKINNELVTVAHFQIPLLCEMHKTPELIVSNLGHFNVRYGTDAAGSVVQTIVTKMAFRSYSGGSYFLTATLPNTLSINYEVASLRSANTAGYIALDAEIDANDV